jgi:hypothetical protein
VIEADRSKQILHDVIHGNTPDSKYSEDDKAHYKTLVGEAAAIGAQGYTPDLPYEWPEFTPEEIAEIKAARQQQ